MSLKKKECTRELWHNGKDTATQGKGPLLCVMGRGRLYFWGAPKSLQMVIAAMKLKNTYSWKKSYDQPRQHVKKQRHYFANKGPSSQGYGFSSGHVWIWELDCEESWAQKNWCFWTVVLEKTLESPSDCKEIQPVHSKENQSWIFIGRTDVEAETLILWPPHVKNCLTGKDPVAGKDWRLEEKGTTEDEMAGWHHWLYGHEFEQTLGVGDGQGGLACCSPWGREESDTTERLIWTELMGRGGGRVFSHTTSLHRVLSADPQEGGWACTLSYLYLCILRMEIIAPTSCMVLRIKWDDAREVFSVFLAHRKHSMT